MKRIHLKKSSNSLHVMYPFLFDIDADRRRKDEGIRLDGEIEETNRKEWTSRYILTEEKTPKIQMKKEKKDLKLRKEHS